MLEKEIRVLIAKPASAAEGLSLSGFAARQVTQGVDVARRRPTPVTIEVNPLPGRGDADAPTTRA
jgi:hypothetical protein